MIKFEEDYFIIQDEESCAFLFRKEDIQKYIEIKNIKSATIDSDEKIIVKNYNSQIVFYFTFSTFSSNKKHYFSIVEEREDKFNTIFTVEIN